MVKKLVVNFATISSNVKTFSAQISTSLTTPKQELSNVSGTLTTSTMPPDRSEHVREHSSTFVEPLIPKLDRASYLNVKNWSADDYNALRRGMKRGGEDLAEDEPTSILSRFMEDENGIQIPEKTKRAVRKMAKGFFIDLLQANNAPAAWGNVPLSVRNKFINTLEKAYPFLWFCEDHWKANQVATNSYSQWYQNTTDRRDNAKAKKACQARARGAAGSEVIIVDTDETSVGEAPKQPRDEEVDIPGPSKRSRVENAQVTPTPRPSQTNGNPQGQKVCESGFLNDMHY